MQLTALIIRVKCSRETIAGCEGPESSQEQLRQDANNEKKNGTEECPQDDFAKREATRDSHGSNAQYPEDHQPLQGQRSNPRPK